jgi:hypothetical protein
MAGAVFAGVTVAGSERGANPDNPIDNVGDVGDPGRDQDQGKGYGPINDDSGERQVVPAPIDLVDILILESFPPQYVVHIVSGLPSGCAQFNELKTERDGNTITITITNTMPTGDVACTMIYGMKDHNVNLGSDFVSGETYTVIVNGESTTFVAQ